MNRWTMLVLGSCLLAGGCGYDGARHAAQDERDAKWGYSRPRPDYFEVEYKNRLYVVSSQKTADAIAKGQPLSQKFVAIGAGPKGQTVVFETSKDGVEGYLIEDYEQKHNIKVM